MAAIAHAFTEQNSNQSTISTTAVDVPGASIASGSFVTGKKYLLVIVAQVSGGPVAHFEVLHGATAFAESHMGIAFGGASTKRATLTWFSVWTAVSGEGIKLQFFTSTGQADINKIAMLAINLSDDVAENTDWFYAERATDDALSTTFLDGASVTFTPGVAGDDWLVLSFAQLSSTSTNTSAISRLNESVGALVRPEARNEFVDNAATLHMGLARVLSLSAAAHTITESAATSTGTAKTRLHSAIVALNLNKFKTHAFAYTEADQTLSATDYATQLQTAAIVPTVTGDVWIGSYFGADIQAVAREEEFRVQVDAADQPASQTTDNYQFTYGKDVSDEQPLMLVTLPSLSAASHTIDLDASADSATSSPAAQCVSLWAVTMELAAAPDTLMGAMSL